MAAGRESLSINGEPQKLKTHPMCQPNGSKITMNTGVDGHSEPQEEAYHATTENVTITVDENYDVGVLQALRNADVVIVQSNGRKFNMTRAFVTNELKLNTENNELQIDFASEIGYFVNP